LTCYLHVDGRRGSDIGLPGLLRSHSTMVASRLARASNAAFFSSM
jgi:hypothetical protein